MRRLRESGHRRPHEMLLRDFLQRSLYGKASGYYSKSVVHRLAQPLKFHRYIGESDYRAALAAEYARSERAWLTPVEIFQPAYAEAIARHALVAHRRRFGASEPLNFLEIGGGTGTAATCILEFLQREAPDSFASCHYKILERTPQLAAAQRQRLSESFDEARWAVEETCAAEWAEAQPPQPGAWHVLALEVLDNLAYDKLRIIPTDGGAAELLEARVEQAGDRWVERYEPLSDAQLRHTASVLGLDSVDGVDALERALSVPPVRGPIGGALAGVRSLLSSVAGRSRSSAREVWVPTFCHRLLTAVAAAVPEHSMLLADFSWFPPQQRGAAVNAPLVQSQHGGETVDHGGDYLRHAGDADVMFATDFAGLARLYQDAAGRPATSMSSADFFRENADVDATATRNGYNPLLEDFRNTRVLVSE